jgi:hypothetical protein
MSGVAVGAERSIRREFSDWVDVGLITKKILSSGYESHARAASLSGVAVPRNSYADVLGYRNRPAPSIKSIEPLRVINT